ncbi:MAG TPA: hypothetical protein VHF06_24480 [Pseudonocardiaceae bacterium]|nr:hypothetical protein [Pseudonocardiaceae bacterium]
MKARTTAIVLTAVLVVYFWLLGQRAVWLIQTGTAAGVGLGVAVLVLPVIGAWIAVVNLRFGAQVERLARQLADEGTLPDASDLPRRPSGRVDRGAADEWFDERKAELEAAPDDWRRWYRLAYAYDLAGDRRRARETMRHALRLANPRGGAAETSA